MNAIERALQAAACCPECQACPYEDHSARYCGDCKELRKRDAAVALKLLRAIKATETKN